MPMTPHAKDNDEHSPPSMSRQLPRPCQVHHVLKHDELDKE